MHVAAITEPDRHVNAGCDVATTNGAYTSATTSGRFTGSDTTGTYEPARRTVPRFEVLRDQSRCGPGAA